MNDTSQNEVELTWKLPILIIVLTLLALLGFQLAQVLQQRKALETTIADLGKQFDDSAKVRSQALGIMSDTVTLGDQGNATANQGIDDVMRRQNVDVRVLWADLKKQIDAAEAKKAGSDKSNADKAKTPAPAEKN